MVCYECCDRYGHATSKYDDYFKKCNGCDYSGIENNDYGDNDGLDFYCCYECFEKHDKLCKKTRMTKIKR
jgi:hypothetical protein